MAAQDVTYFMGQGKVYMAPRQTNGPVNGPYGFLGDCDVLQVSSNQKFDDIEESTTGNRNVAAHIPIGNTYAFKVNCLQWTIANLAKAAYGKAPAPVVAGSVVAEIVNAAGGGYVPLANPGISAVVAVLGGAASNVESVGVTVAGTGGTPGAVLAVQFTGGTPTTPATAVAVINAAGGIDHIEITGRGVGYGSAPTAAVTGITAPTLVVNMGATAIALNTDYTVDAPNGALAIVATSTKVPGGLLPMSGAGNYLPTRVSVNYSYASYTGKVEALIMGITEYSVRFVGLNTANGNAPVLVDVWRISLNIAKTLDLIMNKHGTFELDGMVLPDASRDGIIQSQFYTVTKV